MHTIMLWVLINISVKRCKFDNTLCLQKYKKHFLLFFSSGCKFNNQSLKGRFLITFKPKDSVLKRVFYMYVKGRYTIEPTYGNFFILYRWIKTRNLYNFFVRRSMIQLYFDYFPPLPSPTPSGWRIPSANCYKIIKISMVWIFKNTII